MTATQMEMPLSRKRRTVEERAGDAGRIVDYLRGRGWVTRRTIEKDLGIPDRDIRAAAEGCDDIVSDNAGYKLFEEATIPELTHSADRLISQGKRMIRRGIQQRNKAHGRIGR